MSGAALGETLQGALAKAYNNNSSLNSARAGVRVTDEGVAIAKSGYRPTISGTANGSYVSQAGTSITTGSFGITISQSIFDGFRTKNGIKSAESQVFAARENLLNTEQNILFDAVSAYMDVIRDRKIAALRKKNVAFLREQLRSAQARFEVGEGTRTDVAQADAGRAAALAQSNAADAQAKSSAAVYRQVIGEDPKDLKAGSAASKLLPRSLNDSLAVAADQHPAIKASEYVVDANLYGVKVAEGALLPTLGVEAGVSRSTRQLGGGDSSNIFSGGDSTSDQASVGFQLNVPIYQGGKASATVRQSKERLGQARIEIDVARDSVRAAVTSAWTQMEASRVGVSANKQLVAAAQLALDGVVEERKVGQRTTLDVLNAQSDVVDAQINLVNAERDVVVASYAVLSATGRLTSARLGLNVKQHKPEEHYEAVKDKWFGLRTPDGR
ncbi:MAG: TolC family outer membrane protein [Rhizobiaceae bacterium]